jgi:hypothetical protein
MRFKAHSKHAWKSGPAFQNTFPDAVRILLPLAQVQPHYHQTNNNTGIRPKLNKHRFPGRRICHPAHPALFDVRGQSIIPQSGKYCEAEIISRLRKRIGRRRPGM